VGLAARVVAAVTVLAAAGALSVWTHSESELGGSTLQLVDLARQAPAGAIVRLVAVFVVINPVTEEVAHLNVGCEAAGAAASAAAVVLQAVALGRCMWPGSRPARSSSMSACFTHRCTEWVEIPKSRAT
jgi:hypothetical protein